MQKAGVNVFPAVDAEKYVSINSKVGQNLLKCIFHCKQFNDRNTVEHGTIFKVKTTFFKLSGRLAGKQYLSGDGIDSLCIRLHLE